MKIPRDLSGDELVAALCRHWSYIKVNQLGSHIILQTHEPTPHRVAVPNHKAVRVGTLNGILRAVANHKGVDRQAILQTHEPTPHRVAVPKHKAVRVGTLNGILRAWRITRAWIAKPFSIHWIESSAALQCTPSLKMKE